LRPTFRHQGLANGAKVIISQSQTIENLVDVRPVDSATGSLDRRDSTLCLRTSGRIACWRRQAEYPYLGDIGEAFGDQLFADDAESLVAEPEAVENRIDVRGDECS
tara:strand:+ start:2610 stop:2927 length:318 start_codon:yes stop_codon:yes gene_type:complete